MGKYVVIGRNLLSFKIKDVKSGEMYTVPKSVYDFLQSTKQIAQRRSGTKQRAVKCEQPSSMSLNSGILLLDKAKLDSHIKTELEGITKTRDFVEEIKNTNRRLVVVSGIRRTGKTVGILQYLRYMRNKGYSCCYVLVTINIPFETLVTFLKANCAKYDVVCIDEITKCQTFVSSAAFLSDAYAVLKHKVVISGTDTYSLDRAKDTSLFDRVCYINTTLVSYKECKRLFDKSLNEYMQLNTLRTQQELSIGHLRDLMYLTIWRNISVSVQNNQAAFARYSTPFSEKELWYYGGAILLAITANSYDLTAVLRGTDSRVRKAVRDWVFDCLNSLFIPPYEIDGNSNRTYELMRILEDMQILLPVYNILGCDKPQYIISLQGLSYALLSKYDEHVKGYCRGRNYPMRPNNVMMTRVYKSIIISNLRKAGYEVGYCKNSAGTFKIDIVVKTACVLYFIEVRAQSDKSEKDFKNLRNQTEIHKYFPDKKYKTFVVYTGESENKTTDCYINIEDFLLNYDKYLKG